MLGVFRRASRPLLVLTLAAGVLSGCWPSVGTNFADPGPYPVTVRTDAEHTYFFPTELRDDGIKHPVILWGNGTFVTPTNYEGLLRHLASHGFIVAAANTTNAGSGNEMLAGLDNLTAFNSEPGNVFEGKVDLGLVATMGHSQGGGGAINAARDPRVDTAVPIQPAGGTLSGLHGTVFFLSGTLDTLIPPASVRQKYTAVESRIPAAYGEAAGASHVAPLGNGNEYRRPVTAWLRWQLMGDKIAGNEFVGECNDCTNSRWTSYETNPLLEALAPPAD